MTKVATAIDIMALEEGKTARVVLDNGNIFCIGRTPETKTFEQHPHEHVDNVTFTYKQQIADTPPGEIVDLQQEFDYVEITVLIVPASARTHVRRHLEYGATIDLGGAGYNVLRPFIHSNIAEITVVDAVA